MDKYVIDTQSLVKFLYGQKAINNRVQSILEKADNGEALIIIPSVVIFEIGYLNEKGRIHISLDRLGQMLETSLNYTEERLSLGIIKSAFEITDIPELHDRLIAGTARYLDAPIITNDPMILKSRYVKCVL